MPAALKVLGSGQLLTQTATITGTPTGGTWTPYVNGVSAGAVAYNATAATLQTALRTVDAGVSVTGSAGGPYTITPPIGTVVTVGLNGLTGGTSPAITMAGVSGTAYTVGASTSVKVQTMVLTNTSASPVTVSVSVTPNGGTLDGSRRVVSNYALASNDSTKITEVEGSMLEAGAVVSVLASLAGAVNYLMTGAVIS